VLGVVGGEAGELSALRTARAREASSNSLTVAKPLLGPKLQVMPRLRVSEPPLVETVLRAKRRLPRRAPVRVTWQASALARPRVFWRRARASDSERRAMAGKFSIRDFGFSI